MLQAYLDAIEKYIMVIRVSIGRLVHGPTNSTLTKQIKIYKYGLIFSSITV